jgi:hypothetical protein
MYTVTVALISIILLTSITHFSNAEAREVGFNRNSPTKIEISNLDPVITNYGAAVTQISTLSGHLANNEHYIFSRNTVPGELIGYNVEKNEITLQVSISLGDDRSEASGTMLHIGDELFIAVRFEHRRLSLIRLNRKTGEYQEAVNLHPSNAALDMAISPDGKIFISTSHQYSASVYEFDPDTDSGRWIGSFQTQGRQAARAVAATEDFVFVGTGLEAPDLWQYNRATETKESIFPDELRSVWLDVNAVELHDDWIVAGGSGPEDQPIVVLVNRQDPSEYRLVNHDWNLVQSMVVVDDRVFFGSGEGVWQYNIATDSLNRISDLRCNRGLFYRDGVLHGTDGRRNVGMFDLETRILTVVDLGRDAGAREWPEPGQSMLYSDGKVYVGGHHTIGIHDIEERTYTGMTISGEAKHMIRVPRGEANESDLIFWGGYGSGNMYRFDPDLNKIGIVASAPSGDNRPRALDYDHLNRFVMMGTQSDRNGAGALTIYNLDTEESFIIDRPFSNHSVSAVANKEGIAYIGSAQGRVDPAADARMAAWNPVTSDKLWEITPVPGNRRIRSLINYNEFILGLTVEGNFFVVDPANAEVVYVRRIFPNAEPGRIIEKNDMILAISDNEIRRINTTTFQDDLVVTNLRGQWFHWPSAAIDDDGIIYALKDFDLVGIIPHPQKTRLIHPSSLITVDINPAFEWESLTGVKKFHFQLTETNFSNIFLDTLITGTNFDLPGELKYGESYRWRVRGVLETDDHTIYGEWSDAVLFFTKTSTYISKATVKPEVFYLDQNHPNPFNSSTIINYGLPEDAYVTLNIYDVLGRKVKSLVGENQKAGIFNIHFNAGNLASGVYIYRFVAIPNSGDSQTSIIKTRSLSLMK